MRYDFLSRKLCRIGLYIAKKASTGRMGTGSLVLKGRGNKVKTQYRLIDFRRILHNIPALVLKYEYDPNRNLFLAMIMYHNSVTTYIIAPMLLHIHRYISSIDHVRLQVGDHLHLSNYPIGSLLNRIRLNNAIYGRAAGVFVLLVRNFANYALIRFPSKEERFVPNGFFGTKGRLNNELYFLGKRSKAGIQRHRGIRPHVRGTAMNPIDHPHGGGAARSTAGRPSVSPWYIYTKGIRTTTRFVRKNQFRWGFLKRRSNELWYK